MPKDCKTVKGKRGRPPLPPEEGKRFPLNMRTTKELRNKLAESAENSGRSMAQEVEFRLEKSFLSEDYMTLAFGDFRSSLFARSFLDVMKMIDDYFQKSPWEDQEAHTALRSATDEILLGHQPPDNLSPDTTKKAITIGRAITEIMRDGYKNELQKLAEKMAAKGATRTKGLIVK